MTYCNGKKKTILGFVVLTIIAVFLTCLDNNRKSGTEVANFKTDTINTDIVDYLAANGDDNVEIVYNNTNKSASATQRTTIYVEDVGRSDPFLPNFEFSAYPVSSLNKPRPSYDLLPPPETITSDQTATDVMTTKVSGLMYDAKSPTAIINITGSDYLVKKGDVINDYKVLDIEKNSVTVKYGQNVYKAGVGELFTGEGINYNTVSNLENKFGGANNSKDKK